MPETNGENLNSANNYITICLESSVMSDIRRKVFAVSFSCPCVPLKVEFIAIS